MGKLRLEPKQKDSLSKEEYDHYLGILRDALQVADENMVYWDLDADEKPAAVRKAFVYVAEKSKIDVTVRRVRGKQSLSLQFNKKSGSASNRPIRISAEQSRQRIIDCLQKAGKPLKKNEVIQETGVSPSTWNIRIKDLTSEGVVIREGKQRNITYRLA
ncbi:MAG: winged helix-turn-helix domain-containing protein [Acidobacteriota bacterium]|nr:winged helix-turn-helix domain-containing protein [Acidobacteriota bacterium]